MSGTQADSLTGSQGKPVGPSLPSTASSAPGLPASPPAHPKPTSLQRLAADTPWAAGPTDLSPLDTYVHSRGHGTFLPSLSLQTSPSTLGAGSGLGVPRVGPGRPRATHYESG